MLLPPAPYFGGKRRIASLVWARLGDVTTYLEPFMGMLAVALGRPHNLTGKTEVVNDKDGMVVNLYRAIRAEPFLVSYYLDNPLFESDLHARHAYLLDIRDELSSRLEGNPTYYDPIAAGWWLWGICHWLGGEWGGRRGNWVRQDNRLVRTQSSSTGITRRRPDLGKGIMRKLPAERDDWLKSIASRVSGMNIMCGDWDRIVTDAYLSRLRPPYGVFLDPPYTGVTNRYKRDKRLYAVENTEIARDVFDWAVAHGESPQFRIAMCGLAGEHTFPANWTSLSWNAWGMGKLRDGRGQEVVWFSPHCEKEQVSLFSDPSEDSEAEE